MSGDFTSVCSQMATNDFVTNLKSLSVSQSESTYSETIERLLAHLKRVAPDGVILSKPFSLSVIDNLHRVVPVFAKKLSEKNVHSQQTNTFLQALSNAFQGFCLIELFLAVKDSSCLGNIFRTYLPLVKQEYLTDDNQYDHLANCLLPIVAFSSLFVSTTEDQLPSNFLSNLLEFTKANWRNEERKKVVCSCLGLIKVFSKQPSLSSAVLRSGWASACIEWIKTTGPRPVCTVDLYICSILQKLSRHTTGVEVLNQLNCLQAFDQSKEQMRKDHSEEEYTSIDLLQCITYALLVEADEIKQNFLLADHLMCHILDQIITTIIEASKREAMVYKGCHLTEAICVLSRLFLNDEILKKCLKESNQIFACLSQLLTQFTTINNDVPTFARVLTDEILVSSVNLLWSISFHEFSHEKFRSNSALMYTLSNLATSTPLYTNHRSFAAPQDLLSVKKAAEGIIWNLKSSHMVSPKDKSSQKQPLVMVSYSHTDSEFCRELVEQISAHIPVWVDYKQAHNHIAHSDDLWEEIAGAMESATVILLIVSKEYYDSKSCRQELSYASDTLKKRIVPIYAPNQQYRANGWLGIRIAGQKYIHFGRKGFADAVTELLSVVHADQKQKVSPSVSSPQKTIPKEKEDSLKNWTSIEIRKWFHDNHIDKDLTALFADQFHTGTALIIYARHLKLFYRNEYSQILTNYYQKFNGKRLRTVDFVTFVDAFWRLREKYDPHGKVEDALGKYPDNQLPGGITLLNEGMTWL